MTGLPPALLGIQHRAGAKEHVESWFSKACSPDGQSALWTRATIFARAPFPTVAEAWVIAFDRHRGHVAVKSTVALSTARFAEGRLDVDVDGCTLTPEHARGELSSGRGSVAWDLAIGPALAPPIVHLPSPAMYRRGLPPFSKLVTPVSDARADGVVRVDRGGGDVAVWDVSKWPMMIGHNWGTRNAELYAWTHCNLFETTDGRRIEGLVFEAVSARVRVGPLFSPMTTMAFVRRSGASFDLSGMRSLATNRGMISLRRWEMSGACRQCEVTCEVAAETDDIVGLHYPNPSGTILHCLNSKLARMRLELRLGGETVVALSRSAALEIGTLRRDHGIRMYL